MLSTILTAAITALMTAAITGFVTFTIQERKLRMELRTEFMAEQAVRKLLEKDKWKKRSFSAIQKRIGGFDEDELRKILVRSGAVRFISSEGEELWGLVSRNPDSV